MRAIFVIVNEIKRVKVIPYCEIIEILFVTFTLDKQ